LSETVSGNLRAATDDCSVFCETVMQAPDGERVINAQVHRAWHKHIRWCEQNGKYAGILAPWGHGKTEQVIGEILWQIGRDPNRRIKLVCNDATNAGERVSAVKRYIEKSEDFKQIFPKVQPDIDTGWLKQSFFVKRASQSKDATLEAYGILSTVIGGRCDLLICDDPVDLRNAILQPALRSSVKQAFFNSFLTRMESTGHCIYIATIWHEDDLTSLLLDNEQFSFLIMSVNDAMDGIDIRLTNADKTHPILN